MTKMTKKLTCFSILWMFLLVPVFGSDQRPSDPAPQTADQKAHPGNVLQEGTNPNEGDKGTTGKEQKMVPSVTDRKDLPQETVEGALDEGVAKPARDVGSKNISNNAESEASGDAQKGGGENAKEEKEAGQEKPPLKQRPLDRRWQIKQQAEKEKKPTQKMQTPKQATIKWQNDTQKARCQGYMEDLRARYSKARNYSVQGDACRTAENSEAFLSLLGAFDRECPAEFVQQSGYSETIRENVMRLKELGTKECLRGGKPPR